MSLFLPSLAPAISRSLRGMGIVGLSMLGFGLGQMEVKSETERVELNEAREALRVSQRQAEVSRQELEKSQVQVQTLQERAKLYAESLAAANEESAKYREAYQGIRKELEAMGVQVLASSGGVEKKLLQAINQLEYQNNQNRILEQGLLSLREKVVLFLKDTSNPQMRELLYEELQASAGVMSGGLLAQGEVSLGSLQDASVLKLDESAGLVVANIGRVSGVRNGMPFHVFQGDKPVAELLVVDVRDKICGMMIESFYGDESRLNVGDRLSVKTNQTL